MKLPIARVKDIVEQPLGKELLLYDLKINKSYSLNETLTLIYRSCDGRTTFDGLRAKHRVLTDEIILLGIDELKKEELLSGSFEILMGRRMLLQKAAISAVALPLLIGLTAPVSAQAVSCLADGQPCNLAIPGACCGQKCNITAGGNVCASTTCLADGQSCNLAVPGACCGQRCNITPGGNVCSSATCLASGQPCRLAVPGDCCSNRCNIVGSSTICA